MKKSKRGRGRPREYEPEEALTAALEVFWERGYGGTSLDALSEVTGMNRPSLYAAFGDKKAIYRKALGSYFRDIRKSLQVVLFGGHTLEVDLVAFFKAVYAVYDDAGGRGSLGCPTICTASAEASLDPDIREDLAKILTRLDTAFRKRFELAESEGESLVAPATVLGRQAASLLHSLAIRVRAGQLKGGGGRFIEESIRLLVRG